MGALASKTVIFVTHQIEFLPSADLILVSTLVFFYFMDHEFIYPPIHGKKVVHSWRHGFSLGITGWGNHPGREIRGITTSRHRF
jgi:hypothetical protein